MFYVDELRDKVTPLCWEVARNLVETSMKSGLQEPGTGIFRDDVDSPGELLISLQWTNANCIIDPNGEMQLVTVDELRKPHTFHGSASHDVASACSNVIRKVLDVNKPR